MSDGPFTQSAVRWIVVICAVSLVGGILLAIFAADLAPARATGQDSYSYDALGHLGFARVLERLGIPVVSSRHATAERVRGGAVLVVAAPTPAEDGDRLASLLAAAPRALLVLPKWELRTAWIENEEARWVELLDESQVGRVLHAADVEVTTLRFRREAHHLWSDGIETAPVFPVPVVQVLRGTDLTPLVAYDEGILVGERDEDGRHLIVLADPDLLCNAGIRHAENAQLLVGLVERLRGEGDAVVIDETVHGHAVTPSIWRELFRFPLALVLLHALLLVAVLLGAGMGRFGSPAPPPPVLEPGSRFLIQNTADLLRHGGKTDAVLKQYLKNEVRAVQVALRAPTGLTSPELTAWLDRAAEMRGARDRLPALTQAIRIDSRGGTYRAHVLALARRIHDWRREIVHGHPGRT